MKPLKYTFLYILLITALTACEEEKPEDITPAAGVSNSLHFNFKTPDWEREIDCTHLDLPSTSLNAQTYFTSASSASTKSTFYLSFPKDSSAIVLPANLKKYAITEYAQNNAPFQFSLKLPTQDGSIGRLVSLAGLSESSYNEIVEVKYLGKQGNEALFGIKGKYKMLANELNTTVNKEVSGTFHFKIRTTRN